MDSDRLQATNQALTALEATLRTPLAAIEAQVRAARADAGVLDALDAELEALASAVKRPSRFAHTVSGSSFAPRAADIEIEFDPGDAQDQDALEATSTRISLDEAELFGVVEAPRASELPPLDFGSERPEDPPSEETLESLDQGLGESLDTDLEELFDEDEESDDTALFSAEDVAALRQSSVPASSASPASQPPPSEAQMEEELDAMLDDEFAKLISTEITIEEGALGDLEEEELRLSGDEFEVILEPETGELEAPQRGSEGEDPEGEHPEGELGDKGFFKKIFGS